MSIAVHVGMAEIKITVAPYRLVTSGLGSCIGLCMYDRVAKVGGMAHIMLPVPTCLTDADLGGKYAVTAIPLLLQGMLKNGANKNRLFAKMAGGAAMFTFPGQNSVLKIGERNAQTIREILAESGIPLVAEDVGGTYGRTVQFDTESGELTVKTINHGDKII